MRAAERRQRGLKIQPDVPAGEQRPPGPGRREVEERLEVVHGLFGQLAVGGQLAAEDGQQRGFAPRRALEAEGIVAADLGGGLALLIQQRPYPGVGPDHVVVAELLVEVAVHRVEHVALLLGRAVNRAGVVAVLDVGGADQGEVLLVGNGEQDAAVGVLEDVGVIALEGLAHDDVRAAHQPQLGGLVGAHDLRVDLRGPGAGGVDQRPRPDLGFSAVFGLQGQGPVAGVVAAAGLGDGGAGAHGGAPGFGVHGVEHHQPRVLHPAVGIEETALDPVLQRGAFGAGPQRQPARAGQQFALAEAVVEEQASTDHQERALLGRVRQAEAQRPDDVRRGAHDHLALGEGFADHLEFVGLEVAQAAVDQLGRGRGGAAGEVLGFDQQGLQPATLRIAGDAGAVHTAADNGEIVEFLRAHGPVLMLAFRIGLPARSWLRRGR